MTVVSIIIPCLNEARHIVATLDRLQVLRRSGHEVILCDGGSTDNTPALAEQYVDQIITSTPGRARQMNAGAAIARGQVLCFLHADTLAPENIATHILQSLQNSQRLWGRFDIRLSGRHPAFRVIEWLINKRSCISGIATGDQGLFMHAPVFHQLGGFADIPLMEDIELSKGLRGLSRPLCIRPPLITSSRRWQQNGILATVLLMWQLRLRYFLGTPADVLARHYHFHGRPK